LNSQFRDAHYNLGLLFLKQNRLDEAKAQFRAELAMTREI